MQVFLPYPSFTHSVAVLDWRRLGKQRVECAQLLSAISGETTGWSRHPAALMWRDHEAALGVYMTFCVREWVARGYQNTLQTPYDDRWERCGHASDAYPRRAALAPLPSWLGDEAFHASHRSNLLRKDPDHYGVLGWTESPDMPYIWPTHKETDA